MTGEGLLLVALVLAVMALSAIGYAAATQNRARQWRWLLLWEGCFAGSVLAGLGLHALAAAQNW